MRSGVVASVPRGHKKLLEGATRVSEAALKDVSLQGVVPEEVNEEGGKAPLASLKAATCSPALGSLLKPDTNETLSS